MFKHLKALADSDFNEENANNQITKLSGVPRGISITATDENEIKLNMQMFRLSIVMVFIQGSPVQPFNLFGENRSQSVARQIRQY
jgi:hypothetical protein